ncbi:MAG: lipocalin family protein [Sphingobacteriales bacterium]|nr:lipocalin family protein [Sphingobacteriales bacterium]
MNKLITAIATGFIFILFIACNKDEDPVPKTKTELLTQSSWRFGAATLNGSDVSSQLQACQKDNIMTFAAAGTGTIDEGPTKCNSGDPQTNPFTWSFQSNETVLQMSAPIFSGGSNSSAIVTLNESQLVLSQTITIGTPQTVVVTFVH